MYADYIQHVQQQQKQTNKNARSEQECEPVWPSGKALGW